MHEIGAKIHDLWGDYFWRSFNIFMLLTSRDFVFTHPHKSFEG